MDPLYTIHLIASDSVFAGRLNAAAAQEHAPGDPVKWVWDNRYQLASAPSWAEKVDYWIASNPDADPANGWASDPAVVSDIDITAQVQAVLAESPGGSAA